MKFGSAEDFYIAYAEYVQELEDRAGVPRPCPRCGADVWPRWKPPVGWMLWCSNYPACYYETDGHELINDMWREHEQNCQNADAYAQYCMEEETEG